MYLVPARANTQPALAGYSTGAARQVAAPAGLFVLTMAGEKIRAVTRFHLDDLYPRFGLPTSLPQGEPRARSGKRRP
jgi:RNA polymerase sigma-70 factor (ECF subfamily)